MAGALLIRGARQLLTLQGPPHPRRGETLKQLGIVTDGAVLMENGRISEVGMSRRVENVGPARWAHEIDATGRVVMPGFVDCHTHLAWGPCLLDDDDWTPADTGAGPAKDRSSTRALRSASPKRLASRMRTIAHGALRHGTTTMEVKCGSGLDERGELKLLKVLSKAQRAPLDVVPTFLSPEVMPAAFDGDADGFVNWMCRELLPAIKRRRLAQFVDLYYRPPLFNLARGVSYLEAARALGYGRKVHACGDGSANDTREAVRLGVELGALSVDHVDGLESAEAELLGRSETIAVLLPGPAFHRGTSPEPARKLIEAGAAAALGTDFSTYSSPTYSMQMILSLACRYLRMSPEEAISAATYNAACALGISHRAGSLQTGKAADAIILNAGDYREIPCHFGVNLVHTAVKNGVIVYSEGKVLAH